MADGGIADREWTRQTFPRRMAETFCGVEEVLKSRFVDIFAKSFVAGNNRRS
jgi:hypothetical protein